MTRYLTVDEVIMLYQDEQEQIILGVASNTITREQLTTWIAHHLVIKQ